MMRARPLIPAVALASVLLGARPAHALGLARAETELVIRQDTVIGGGGSSQVVSGADPVALAGFVDATEVVVAGPCAAGARALPAPPTGPEWASVPRLSAAAAPAPQRPTVAATANSSRAPTRSGPIEARIGPQRPLPIALDARPGQPRAPPR